MLTGYAPVANITTALAIPEFPEGKQGKVRSVTVYYGKTSAAGRELTIYLGGNNVASVQLDDGVSTVTSDNLITRYTDPLSGTEFGNFSDIRVLLAWGSGTSATYAPVVKKIVIDYELVNLKQ